MTKRNKIIYWIATVWLALGMISTGVVQLMRMKEEIDNTVVHLGYPVYFLTLLGIWKILGVAIVLMPRTALLKEWAYAGFFFAMSGAVSSHLAANNIAGIFGPTLLLLLTAVSWYFRPVHRRIITINQ